MGKAIQCPEVLYTEKYISGTLGTVEISVNIEEKTISALKEFYSGGLTDSRC